MGLLPLSFLGMKMNTEVRIETSTICNYHCKFCPHGTASFTRKKEIMSYEMFTAIVDKLPPHITDITLSGFNEAFLDQTILPKIGYAKNKGKSVHVLTNGSLLNKTIIDSLIEIGIQDLRISLHAIDPTVHKTITGCDNSATVASLTYAITTPLSITITADIIEENASEVDAIKAWSDKVDLVEIWKPHNWADWGTYRKPTCKKITCGRPFNGPIQVQVDGTVNMCCFDYNGKLLLGDATKESFEEIFSGKKIAQIQAAHKSVDKTGLLCGVCDQLYFTNNVIIYNSKYDPEERINLLSTTHKNIV